MRKISVIFSLWFVFTIHLSAQVCTVLNEIPHEIPSEISLEQPPSGAPSPNEATTSSFEGQLADDGTLRFGASGTYSNLEGIEISYTANGSPRFVRRAAGWNALGAGTGGEVFAIAISGSDVYVGGIFTTAGSTSASNIAKWDGAAWSVLGAGVNGKVNTIALSGSNLYAGGLFTTAGSSTVNYVAKWDGASWSALGTGSVGVGTVVYAIAISGSNVYVGGSFTLAGGASANHVAKWDGAAWSALGAGVDNTVRAIAISGSDLYVGGFFANAGGASASRIAKWDGVAWSALGTGVDNTVYAIATSGSDVYVGGNFVNAGSASANRIAKWNGAAWSPLGTGVNATVYSIAISGSSVFAGGDLTTAGGASANYIAKWNGSAWSALDTGLSSFVDAIVITTGNLYVGGLFTQAGSALVSSPRRNAGFSPSQENLSSNDGANESMMTSAITASNIVRWEDAALPISLVSTSATVSGQDAMLKWETASESDNERFVIEERIESTWKSVGEVKGAGTTTQPTNYTFAIPNLSFGLHQFRLVQHDYNGTRTYSDVIQVQVELADKYFLSEVYPNPFNPSTTFTLAVATDQQVQINVFDLTGRLVQTLHNGQLIGQTTHAFTFDGRNLASGKYLVRITGEAFMANKMITMVK